MKNTIFVIFAFLFSLNSYADSGCLISINETDKLNWENSDTFRLAWGDSTAAAEKLKLGQVFTSQFFVPSGVSLNMSSVVLADIDSEHQLRANIYLTTQGINFKAWLENKLTFTKSEIMYLTVDGIGGGVYQSYSSDRKLTLVSSCGFSGQ